MTETLAPRVGSPLADAPECRPEHPTPFDELKAASRPVCETAVDATDIAVMLETDGVTDAIAAGRYAALGTQDLAERLLLETPTHATALVLARDDRGDGTRPSGRLIRRGALYAAPGAFYVAIAADFHSEWAGLAIVGATATGWMISQVIGLIAHRLTVRTGPGNTHAVLRRCLLASTPAAAGLGLACEPLVGTVAATVLATQIVFAAAAAVLLFYDADRVLAYCVIPGAIVAGASAADLSGRWPEWLPSLVAALAAAVTALVTAAAAWAVRSTSAAPGEPPGVRYPTRRELSGALPYVLYGMLCAVALISGPMIVMIGADGGVATTESGLVVLPVVLGMGYGELQIRRLRASCQSHATLSTTMRRYRRQTRADLVRMEVRMTLAFSLITVVTTTAIWAVSGQGVITAGHAIRSGAYVVLGCALIVGLAGCAFARPLQIAAAFVIAFGAISGAGLVASSLDLRTPAGYLVASVLLLASVHVAAVRVVQNPVAVIG